MGNPGNRSMKAVMRNLLTGCALSGWVLLSGCLPTTGDSDDRDGQACGFLNLSKGTSWVYQESATLLPTYKTFRHVDDIVKRGDSVFYSMDESIRYDDPAVAPDPIDGSFILLETGGTMRVWAAPRNAVAEGSAYPGDCVEKSAVKSAFVLGENRLVYTEIDSGSTMNGSGGVIRVKGIGTVHTRGFGRVGNTGWYETHDDLIEFNGRKVKIKSLDPLDIVYE
jgi:hypothetical protein